MRIQYILRKLANYYNFCTQHHLQINNRIRTTIDKSYALIHHQGFQPKTIIDVGVAAGTPELYRTFPDCYFLLIEPLKAFEPNLIKIVKEYRGSYVLAAAGAHSGKAIFNVHQNHLDGSSLHKETMGEDADGIEIIVPVVTIDEIIKDKKLDGPYLLKIDIQGAELTALDGAQVTLKDTEVVVLEVSLFEFMTGAPQFYDVISYMKARDFVVYDIIHGWNRPLDNALGQVDIMFVKDKGMFRQNHSYATKKQLQNLFSK